MESISKKVSFLLLAVLVAAVAVAAGTPHVSWEVQQVHPPPAKSGVDRNP